MRDREGVSQGLPQVIACPSSLIPLAGTIASSRQLKFQDVDAGLLRVRVRVRSDLLNHSGEVVPSGSVKSRNTPLQGGGRCYSS